MNLYTKNGKPLQVNGDLVHSKSGKLVGKIQHNKVYGPNGRYVGTIVSDRLVFRSADSAQIYPVFSSSNRSGVALANRAGVAIYGEEPNIPD